MTNPSGGPVRGRGVYAGARVEELEEPLLPRWFVLLAVALIPVALGVAVWAFIVFGPEEVPVAERRPPPPPTGQLTTDVGGYDVGESVAQPIESDCSLVQGIRVAGSQADRDRITHAAEALCDVTLPEDAARRLVRFGQLQGEVRFAQFQLTGIDSTMDVAAVPPRLLLNARFAQEDTDPLWITPLLVHDTTFLDLDPSQAQSALTARIREADVCTDLFTSQRPSRACDDAAALLDLLDPLRALQAAGFE